MSIKIPDLPEDAPNRIRSLKEIVTIIYKPLTFLYQFFFFIYRTYVCPNIVDTIAILGIFILLGIICIAVNVIIIISIPIYTFLILPPLLTRETVYNGIMLHLGHPIPEKSD